jgi:hypothetical protein
MLEQIERQKALNLCGYCKLGIEKDQATVMLQSSECFHSVHQECFKRESKTVLLEN